MDDGSTIQLNGIAHIQLSVRDVPRAVSFYRPLLAFFGMKPILDMDGYFYCVGSRTGVVISPAADELRDEGFDQGRPGLHHVCFRARSRGDVDRCFSFVQGLGARIVHGPQEDAWAPGYYSVLFEDPDGIRLEVNHVPGKGHLEPGGSGIPVEAS